MAGLLPAAVFGLEVPNGDVMIPAVADFPAAFRITMAAIDPSAEPEFAGTSAGSDAVRATLKLIREPMDDDEDDDDEDEDELDALLNGEDSEEDSEDEDKVGGPSDPSKSKKARQVAAIEALKSALAKGGEDSDDEMVDGLSAIKKGKGKATEDDDDEDSDDDDEDDDELDLEEFVICTLDPSKNYQQPLDITIGEGERVYFKVSGTHTIYLTGNYVIPVDDSPREMYDDGEDDEYDLSPDEDELDDGEESDELDDMDDPRITEVDSDEEEAPKLVKADKKGKNKRAAEESDEEAVGLDEIMTKSLKPEINGETKLSKKQQKKLKNNAGEAVPAAAKKDAESPASKKVQFAKNLEQGPTGTKADAKTADKKPEAAKAAEKGKAALGVKTVNGVKIDDKKLGSGPAAKKGNRVGMRYIGKLDDGKVFDSNKKGKPFSFKLGAGEVIKGWDIGVEGMAIGGERRIVIPAHLAYGSKGMPGIPGNSQLTFDLKLLEIH